MAEWFRTVEDSGDIACHMLEEANRIRNEDIESCRMIGVFGLPLIEEISRKKNGLPVNILTHCNAGWLACVQWGTATAPIYMAHRKGIPLHVWVDETRPRNQGARLTAFELGLAGIPHTVVPDNAGGHLMQHGKVDMVIVGSDRTTRNGDVANKIGTYLKAVAAADNNIPFYAALPASTFDPDMTDGIRNIPVEERSADEVACMEGWNGKELIQVKLIPDNTRVANFGFDVTPARLITLLITDRGLCTPGESEIVTLLQNNHE
jgi:methylthioribose-1-phosphate isomerase